MIKLEFKELNMKEWPDQSRAANAGDAINDYINAFEDQTPAEPVKIFVNPEIGRIEAQIKTLRAMNLHRTADVNQRKLDRLLQEEMGTLEG